MSDPAEATETDTDDRLEQLEPVGGVTVEEAVEGDDTFAGPDAEERAEDERLAEDGRDTGE